MELRTETESKIEVQTDTYKGTYTGTDRQAEKERGTYEN